MIGQEGDTVGRKQVSRAWDDTEQLMKLKVGRIVEVGKTTLVCAPITLSAVIIVKKPHRAERLSLCNTMQSKDWPQLRSV